MGSAPYYDPSAMTRIPHDFRDASLYELALTHSSAGAAEDNERLEFLGDAVLDLIVAEVRGFARVIVGRPLRTHPRDLRGW